MRSLPEFLLIALLVTLTPGPGTAMILRVAARDGRAAALATAGGNSAGILVWAALSAVGVSSLVLASQIAHDVLRIGGAAVLIALGLRSLLHRAKTDDSAREAPPPRGLPAGWRIGLVTALANPKLAVFFIALFPAFLRPDANVLPAALTMAAIIVAFDLVWFSALAFVVDRAREILRPRVRRAMERASGAVLLGFGIRLATESR